MTDYEKLGLLYLGRLRSGDGALPSDATTATTTREPYLYDSRDLVTHAAIVGMTGSGKTGLGAVLIEEAAIDGIPVIAIDPKGDLSNLMLTFPALAPSDFRPWIDEHDAARRGTTADVLAASEAVRWREGLAAWDQTPERIARFASAVDRVVYTPGSDAGRRLGLLRSFAPPGVTAASAPDVYREKLAGTTSALLALLDLDEAVEEPARMLVAAILDHAWSLGQSPSLADIVHAVTSPPVQRVGVMDVESFFPAKTRFGLAMKLNALLAGTGASAWSQGEPLDIDRLLRSASGKPRLSILSIAHLGDAERMFFVTTLLTELVAWMRRQSGTSSLRAIVYLDEAMGYLPPVRNPPSKAPMLTLLKQARAFGLGVVVATQNPVDLDYKALSNAGTWFLGRLQTERDRLRVLDALESAARPGFERGQVERLVAGLATRQFLAHSTHRGAAETFESRWALSYLRGPLTPAEITSVMESDGAPDDGPQDGSTTGPGAPTAGLATAAPTAGPPPDPTSARPALPPEVRQVHLPIRSAAPAGSAAATYLPALLAVADLTYTSPKHVVDLVWTLRAVAPIVDGPIAVDWAQAGSLDVPMEELATTAPATGSYGALAREATMPKSYPRWQKAFEQWASRTQTLTLLHCAPLELTSYPGESRAQLVARASTLARELRDRELDALRRKHAPKITAAAQKLEAADIRAREMEQRVDHQRLSAGLGIGSSIVGALLGRKTLSVANVNRAGRAVRGAHALSSAGTHMEKARQSIEVARERLRELESALEAEIAALDARVRAIPEQLEEIRVKPKKADVHTTVLALAWVPFWRDASGGFTRA